MENLETTNTPLFGLSIDNTAKSHLSEAARWARFISIVGFIFLGFFVVFAIFAGTMMTAMFNRSAAGFEGETGVPLGNGFAVAMTIYYLVIGLFVFFMYLFLYRFAAKMKKAIAGNDQDELNGSFMNLKALFRYVGILTIIGLVMFGIAMLWAVVVFSAMR